MNKISLTLLSSALLLNPVLQAAEKVDQSAALESGAKLNIKIQRGEVKIRSWDKAEVAIKGKLDELSEGLVFGQQGGSFVIEDKLPKSYNSRDKDGSKLEIFLPATVNMKLKGVSADYDLQGLEGEIYSANVSGDIKGQDLKGNLQLTTVSGSIHTQSNQGELYLETVSGDIEDKQSLGKVSYRLVSGKLNAESDAIEVELDQVSGKSQLTLNTPESLKARTVSGDLSIAMQSLAGNANVDSVSGDIELKFAKLPNAAFDISGGPGGKIDNQLTQDSPKKAKYTKAESLQFQSGSGQADVNINTISGRIKLQQ
ncbi:DUF4097 family beta strand repeat-containing protein [Shewanella algae]|uniref:DUF4097 family beta strand repeat-containing protein n=1 Tax=Shewanella algae TaxID=38313 RepID=UPI001AAD526B|nr:DUF4097 family beta strand repeat-containing protein [Shewanella algae]MBO2689151.1 DUF4097 family beta strand repeat protein [Shewanella algae]